MSFFRVTSSELRRKASRISELNSQFRSKANELGEQEKDAFHQAFLRDRQQMEIFHQLIGQYVQTLLEIASRYERAEERNREIAASRNY